MKTIVITGSTRGIGLGMAEEFLQRGHQVVISGRSQADVDRVAAGLRDRYPGELIFGKACDVTDFAQVQALWDAGQTHFGWVDIWINNAGQAHALSDFWDLPIEQIESIVRVNVIGQMYGVKTAVTGMLKQGGGAIYLMEGQGANGRIVNGLTLYGATKRATNFLFEALVEELKDTPVIAGSLSPGMVVTDLLTVQREADPETWERNKRIFNILAEKVETVAPQLAEQILTNHANGRQIRLLGRGQVIWRFLTAPFNRRDLFAGED